MSDQHEATSPSRPELNLADEAGSDKLKRKSKDNPMMVVGLTGCAIIAAYGIYKYKNRGNLSVSNYFMQLRVAAQGAVIGCLTLGVCKSLYDHFKDKGSDDST